MNKAQELQTQLVEQKRKNTQLAT